MLGSYTVPSSVLTIGDWAFSDCDGLTKVYIGSGMQTLGEEAFWFCPNLTSVLFQGNEPTSLTNPFIGDDEAIVYYTPGRTGWAQRFTTMPMLLWNPTIRLDSGLRPGTNGFGFTIVGISNLVVMVEASTNLAAPEWSPVGTNTLNGGTSQFSDAESANFPARFYRLTPP